MSIHICVLYRPKFVLFTFTEKYIYTLFYILVDINFKNKSFGSHLEENKHSTIIRLLRSNM